MSTKPYLLFRKVSRVFEDIRDLKRDINIPDLEKPFLAIRPEVRITVLNDETTTSTRIKFLAVTETHC